MSIFSFNTNFLSNFWFQQFTAPNVQPLKHTERKDRPMTLHNLAVYNAYQEHRRRTSLTYTDILLSSPIRIVDDQEERHSDNEN